MVSQRIEKSALAAAAGNREEFGNLREGVDGFTTLVQELKEGVAAQGIPASPEGVAAELREMDAAWQRLQQNGEDILANQESVLAVRSQITTIGERVSALEARSGEVTELLLEHEMDAAQVARVSEQMLLAERIDKSVSNILRVGVDAEATVERIRGDVESYQSLLGSLRRAKFDNPLVAQKLREIGDIFNTVQQSAGELVAAAPSLLPALQAAAEISDNADRVSAAASALIDAYGQGPGRVSVAGLQAGPLMVALVSVVGALFLLLIMWQQISRSKERELESKQQNERNQQAILRLLDEMGDLADGDLTVKATVTEDVTGAIADSINYAIEALRSLVTTINDTSTKVSSAAQESRATAMHLAEASDHQSEQLVSTTYSIKEMTLAMDQMASDATESSEIAQRSVEIAAKGASTVRHAIQGMDTIREQIQETSKRIKRLGESSQEIGDIVELIDDIADQTNILALNAAMQAAMAGEAGRGFAVVADEVQRLAERSSNATKQIEALVKTIRADTNEAVSSMENTTRDVVYGAKLSEDAGEALKEIENVSQHISERISAVAESAQKQSDSAALIDQTMGVIREITTQTSDSTSQTAASIGVLADLSAELQQSVAGFRLPE
ncbi:MAG: type IV pili methyl-accepting chemotaxis transducer N-terminal domain-containing protein [Gammaproteobacteria bacterium]|nr:type IV pili methyl-accepting chemotaxis transducer N-terminal domain-containing protein [Gammaproteobacteria bacterium]